MTAKELYDGIVAGDITVSKGLALARVYLSLDENEQEWVNSELVGYKGNEKVPAYRQFPCKISSEIIYVPTGNKYENEIQGEGIEKLDKVLNDNLGLSIYKMYVTIGVELIEKHFQNQIQGDAVLRFEGKPRKVLLAAIQATLSPDIEQVQDVWQSSDVAYMHKTLYVIKELLLKIILKHISKEEVHAISNPQAPVSKNKIFISYCWEDTEHQRWVKKFAEDLKSDFEVLFDNDLPYGFDLSKFMEESVNNADKVLMILTPRYKERADDRTKGVGYEASLISNDIITDQNTSKFIPIIRRGLKEQSYPRSLGNRKGIDMTDNSKYNQNLKELIKDIKRTLDKQN